MDPIKEAFQKAKQDIEELKDHLYYLYQEIDEMKQSIQSLISQIVQQTNQQTNKPANHPANQDIEYEAFQQAQPPIPSNQQITPTENLSAEVNPTDNLPFKALKTPIFNVSSGNDGVPTDRQTNQQTNQHIGNEGVSHTQSASNSIQRVSELINSLDALKQEVRFKFKKLTSQEMLVFSTIYQLESLGLQVDYPLVAKKLSLTESSIRDYTQKIIKKGIPLIKLKENNKKIFISISPDLKKIASLSTILQLREI
ncbi:MAG: hypothetical protein AABX07_02725 [Nanoarchaeota archaeon]